MGRPNEISFKMILSTSTPMASLPPPAAAWAHWQLALAYARYLARVPPLVQHRRP